MSYYRGEIGPGKIVVYATYKPKLFKKGEGYSKLQNIFTRMIWTHTALGFFKFEKHSNDTIFESNELQCTTLWNARTLAAYEIYKIMWYTQEEIEKALWKTFIEYNGTSYGFLQILYFVRRWFWETPWIKRLFWWIPTKILGKPDDIRQWNNWFVGGTICSELFYNLMENLNSIRRHERIEKMLATWNRNNFHSGDSVIFMKEVPEVFELEYHKDGGVVE